jgi:diguanylate cyclase (GGDEF)-like protein
LISLRKTANELEHLEEQRTVLADSYRRAIRTAGEYAIELDAQETSAFRERLETLAAELESAGASQDLRRAQGAFRSALRDYRDQSKTRIDHLRREVDAGAAAVAAFAGTLASHGADHQAQMDTELGHLRKISAWDDLAEIRSGIQGVISGISDAVAQMQRSNQMTIAQLRDEIRTLHQSMEARRRAAATDTATGAWNRQKCEHRMRDLLKEDEAFCVLLIAVNNFKRLEGRYSPRVAEGVLKEFTNRLRGVVGAEPPLGRWTDHEFLVMLDLDPSSAIALSREVSSTLSAAYALPDGLSSKPIPLEVATGLVERPAGSDGEAFLKKLDQLSAALSRG